MTHDSTSDSRTPEPFMQTPENSKTPMSHDTPADAIMRDPAMDDVVSDAVLAYFDEAPAPAECIASPPEMWGAIDARLASRDVIPLHAADRVPSRARHRAFPSWATMLIAASLLVIATASVTYVVTVRRVDAHHQVVSALPQSRRSDRGAPTSTVTEHMPNTDQSDAPPYAGGQYPSPSGVPVVNVVNGQQPVQDWQPDVYDKEIAELQTVMKDKRAQLKPETIKTLEDNMKIIDEAIRQSRAALAKDPGSRFLSQQLDRARAKKISLLRTAALLPASA